MKLAYRTLWGSSLVGFILMNLSSWQGKDVCKLSLEFNIEWRIVKVYGYAPLKLLATV